MAGAAVVIADHGEIAGAVGRESNFFGFVVGDVNIDFERLLHEAVHPI